MDDGQPQPRDWLTQARRGVIELATLVLIGRAPHYGYEIAVALSHWQPLAASEGTLYPLLRRLDAGAGARAARARSPRCCAAATPKVSSMPAGGRPGRARRPSTTVARRPAPRCATPSGATGNG